MLDFDHARQHMVDWQIARRGIHDRRLLAAMGQVPRENFVDPGYEEFAYDDSPLPIAHGQSISQPYIVALMIEAAEIGPRDRVLEIGTGSGYAAAVIARLAGQVFTIERHEALGRLAQRRLAAIGADNVTVRIADGSKGWPEEAPFDVIIVAAGSPAVPAALKDQLGSGGRTIIPVGEAGHDQRLIRVTRSSTGKFEEEDLGGVKFVPLVSEEGG